MKRGARYDNGPIRDSSTKPQESERKGYAGKARWGHTFSLQAGFGPASWTQRPSSTRLGDNQDGKCMIICKPGAPEQSDGLLVTKGATYRRAVAAIHASAVSIRLPDERA
jgi:hypothetical protein